jgi:hypothetical protein
MGQWTSRVGQLLSVCLWLALVGDVTLPFLPFFANCFAFSGRDELTFIRLNERHTGRELKEETRMITRRRSQKPLDDSFDKLSTEIQWDSSHEENPTPPESAPINNEKGKIRVPRRKAKKSERLVLLRKAKKAKLKKAPRAKTNAIQEEASNPTEADGKKIRDPEVVAR